MTVPRDPDLFAAWTWFEHETPNKEPLRAWALSFFPLCMADTCGDPGRTPKASRIDLTQADLRRADLQIVRAVTRKGNYDELCNASGPMCLTRNG
jgi:hypothetical protein